MITSSRMYNAAPGAVRAWRALFSRAFEEAGTDVAFIDHGAPLPIADLWVKPGLTCAFMCGWPFARSGAMQPIAAPVPLPPRYAGLPRYRSEFLVRIASRWHGIEDTFGHRIGWMARDSHSGYNAPRAFLSRYARPDRPRLYAEARGPLGAPMQAIEALAREEVDVVALDSFYLDLLRHQEPRRLNGFRTVAETPWAPIPLLVAAPDVDPEVVARLRAHLLGIHEQPSYVALLNEVLLVRFAAPDVAAYRSLEDLARLAVERGYPEIA